MRYFCMKIYRKLFSEFTELLNVFFLNSKQYYNTGQTNLQTLTQSRNYRINTTF